MEYDPGTRKETLSRDRPRLRFYRGRVALYWLLRALSIGVGDEVILQAYTCPEVAQPILRVGATPVFCDTEPDGFNLCCEALARKITRATKAVIIQHTFGIPANMNDLMPVLRQLGVAVIEDCCHVCASEYDSVPVGSFGNAAFFSYGPDKPISAGLGGEAVLNSPALASDFRSLYITCITPSFSEEIWSTLRIAVKAILPAETVVLLRDTVRRQKSPRNGPGQDWIEHEYDKRLPRVAEFHVDRLLARADRILAKKRLAIQQVTNGINALGLRCAVIPEPCSAVLWRIPVYVRNKPKLRDRARQCAVEILDWGTAPFRSAEYPASECDGHRHSCPNARELTETVVTVPIHGGLSRVRIEKLIRFLAQMRKEGIA